MAKFVLSAFADEAGAALSDQLDALREEQISLIELRNVDGKSCADLTGAEAVEIKKRLDGAGVRLSSLGSPYGKAPIDAPFDGWEHKVGLIPNVLKELNPSPNNCVAVLCGPPIMIKFTVQALESLNFAPENIVTTLEKRMKCGIGICGRCNIGGRYVCVDGPVFTWKQLQELPPEL